MRSLNRLSLLNATGTTAGDWVHALGVDRAVVWYEGSDTAVFSLQVKGSRGKADSANVGSAVSVSADGVGYFTVSNEFHPFLRVDVSAYTSGTLDWARICAGE